jgi:hypothetical protein
MRHPGPKIGNRSDSVYEPELVADLVFAGFAAGGAIIESIFPEADIELPLTKDAVLFTVTALFNLLALAATGFGLGRHIQTLAPAGASWNVPLVTRVEAQAASSSKDRAQSQRALFDHPKKCMLG